MTQRIFALILTTACVSAGCHNLATTNWQNQKIKAPRTFGSDNLTHQQEVEFSAVPWWKTFEDKKLSDLINKVLTNNMSLEQAAFRLARARAQSQLSASSMLPQLTTQASRFEFSGRQGFLGGGPNAPGGGVGGQVSGNIGSLYSSTTGVSYELDLWGKLFAQNSRDQLNAQASREDLQALALTLSGQAFEEWLTIAETSSRIKLIKEQIETNSRNVKLQKIRFAQGNGSLLTVLQARQQLLNVESERTRAVQANQLACARIAILAGSFPTESICKTASLPSLPEMPVLPLPATVLLQRPDVRAALLKVQGADFNAAAALANHLPSIRLSLSWQYNASSLQDLFESSFRNILTALDIPWFDGGRRLAEQKSAQSQLGELVAAYKETILNAFFEIESALIKERTLTELLATIEKQQKTAQDTYNVALKRYTQGAADYTDVILANDTAQTIQRRYLLEQKNLLANRGMLYRAFGAMTDLTNPDEMIRNASTKQFFEQENQ